MIIYYKKITIIALAMGYFSPREIKKKHSLVDALFNILHNNSIDLFSPTPKKLYFFYRYR